MARVVVTRSNHTGGLALVAGVVVAVATAGAVLVVALGALVVWLAVRHPFSAAALAGSALAVAGGGWPAALGLWAAVAAGALLWRWRDRAGFDRAVLRRWRRTFVYGRRWRRAMVACALDGPGEWRRPVPRLGTVRSTRWTDTVRVHLLDDQTPELLAARAPHLAAALGARSCRVRDDGAGAVTLELRRGDPLSRPVPPLPVPDRPDLDALVVGTHEDGAPWTVRLARGHLLVAGAPGTGDGTGRESVVWSLVRSLAARVRDGSVELWGVDGGGPDLGIGAALFTRLAAADRDPGIAVVEDAAALVHERRPGARPRRPAGRAGARRPRGLGRRPRRRHPAAPAAAGRADPHPGGGVRRRRGGHRAHGPADAGGVVPPRRAGRAGRRGAGGARAGPRRPGCGRARCPTRRSPPWPPGSGRTHGRGPTPAGPRHRRRSGRRRGDDAGAGAGAEVRRSA